jgi:hypothetical protein
MHFPMMTMRRWMFAVAVVAVIMSGGATLRRWAELAAEYRRAAAFHSVLAKVYRSGSHLGSRVEDPAETSRLVAHQLRLAEKYQLAARRPWLPVPPDPPEPK